MMGSEIEGQALWDVKDVVEVSLFFHIARASARVHLTIEQCKRFLDFQDLVHARRWSLL